MTKPQFKTRKQLDDRVAELETILKSKKEKLAGIKARNERLRKQCILIRAETALLRKAHAESRTGSNGAHRVVTLSQLNKRLNK